MLHCLVICQECVNIPAPMWAITPVMGVFEMSWQESLNCSQRKLSLPKGWDLQAPVADLVTHGKPFRLVTHQIMKANEEFQSVLGPTANVWRSIWTPPKLLMGLKTGGRSTARVLIRSPFLSWISFFERPGNENRHEAKQRDLCYSQHLLNTVTHVCMYGCIASTSNSL